MYFFITLYFDLSKSTVYGSFQISDILMTAVAVVVAVVGGGGLSLVV